MQNSSLIHLILEYAKETIKSKSVLEWCKSRGGKLNCLSKLGAVKTL